MCIRGIDRKKSPLSEDTDSSDLINEELSRPRSFIMKSQGGRPGRVWAMILEFVDISDARERRRICLERIFTTGIALKEYGRYYPENF